MKVGDLVRVNYAIRRKHHIPIIGVFVGYVTSLRVRSFVFLDGAKHSIRVDQLEVINESR